MSAANMAAAAAAADPSDGLGTGVPSRPVSAANCWAQCFVNRKAAVGPAARLSILLHWKLPFVAGLALPPFLRGCLEIIFQGARKTRTDPLDQRDNDIQTFTTLYKHCLQTR